MKKLSKKGMWKGLEPLNCRVSEDSLSEKLKFLHSLGKCRIASFEKKWYAHIELFVESKDVNLEIRTKMNFETADEAVDNLIKRIDELKNVPVLNDGKFEEL